MTPAPFVTTQHLRFCDTDAIGHVNNAVYAVMYEAGRSELAASLGLLEKGGPVSLVIARLEVDFLREMNWPGDVRIETAVGRIGGKSVQLRQRLVVADEIVSRAVSVIVVIDVATRRGVPLSEEWRAALAGYVIEDF